MSCSILTQITRSCDGNIGGIREVYLWDMEDQLFYEVNQTTWQISTTAPGLSAVGATSITGYTFTRESSNFTDELAADFVNGSTVWTATLNLMFTRREALKSRSIKILADGQRYLGALVKDENGLWWVFQDLQLSAAGDGSGTTKEDGSKYSVTLVGKTAYPAVGIAATAAASFLLNGTAY
jgi:hypothetical protein